jgi:hypothetical protein
MLGSACRSADNTPLGSLLMLAWIATQLVDDVPIRLAAWLADDATSPTANTLLTSLLDPLTMHYLADCSARRFSRSWSAK